MRKWAALLLKKLTSHKTIFLIENYCYLCKNKRFSSHRNLFLSLQKQKGKFGELNKPEKNSEMSCCRCLYFKAFHNKVLQFKEFLRVHKKKIRNISFFLVINLVERNFFTEKNINLIKKMQHFFPDMTKTKPQQSIKYLTIIIIMIFHHFMMIIIMMTEEDYTVPGVNELVRLFIHLNTVMIGGVVLRRGTNNSLLHVVDKHLKKKIQSN